MGWVQDIVDWIVWSFKSLVLTLWDAVSDVFFLIIETIMSLAGYLISSAFSGLDQFNPSSYISGLSAGILNMMGMIGIQEATAIILGAIVIRLLLQIIPFTRLGS